MWLDVEVDHLTDWSLAEWWLHYLGALAAPFAAALLLFAGYLAIMWLLDSLRPPDLAKMALILVGGSLALVIAVLALRIHADLLYDSLRHATSMTRSVLAAGSVAAIMAAAAFALATRFRVGRTRWLALIAGTAATPALACLATDRLTRWAAEIPMALPAFLMATTLGALFMAAALLDRR